MRIYKIGLFVILFFLIIILNSKNNQYYEKINLKLHMTVTFR